MIRTASPEDASFVAPLMFQAMSDIVFKLINRNDPKEATQFLERLFIEKNNQYSYENTLVYEKDNQILGSLVYYNGAHIDSLSQAVFDFVHSSYGHHIRLEPETQAGEYYIDTLSVSPKVQGKGLTIHHYLDIVGIGDFFGIGKGHHQRCQVDLLLRIMVKDF